jgi:hypothetical protein
MLERIISGGQTGVDQAALRAARAQGIPTGGFAPRGWQTEAGPAPWLADFGLVECDQPGYPSRTEANVLSADATLILIGSRSDRGTDLTRRLCESHSKPLLVQSLSEQLTQPTSAAWLRSLDIRTLNIAGPREGSLPGIGALAEAFLRRLFAEIRRH